MLPESDYATAVGRSRIGRVYLAGVIGVAMLACACSSPEESSVILVEKAWEARVTGDAEAFRTVIVAADRPHVEKAGAVMRVNGLDDATRQAMVKALKVDATGKAANESLINVDASVTWLPPGPGGVITEQYAYQAVKTDDGWRLDLGLEARADVARKLSDARAAIRAGRPEQANRVLNSILVDELPVSERSMAVDAVEATRASVESAGVLSELRDLMQAHHNTEDPAERANLVKKARELGIEDLQLPDDIATLWADASEGAEVANRVHELGENMLLEGEAKVVGHGAEIAVSVTNNNDVPVEGLEFQIDLIDSDGVRLHRVTHRHDEPVAPGTTATTMATAPSVPSAWKGAINVRLSAASEP